MFIADAFLNKTIGTGDAEERISINISRLKALMK